MSLSLLKSLESLWMAVLLQMQFSGCSFFRDFIELLVSTPSKILNKWFEVVEKYPCKFFFGFLLVAVLELISSITHRSLFLLSENQ